MAVKFLVIRFSSIGDIVLTSPVLRVIKNQVPGSEVHFVTKSAYSSLMKANPHIDKIHILEDKISPLIEQLSLEKFDYIIDLHNNIRSGQIKRHVGAKSFTFNKLNIKKWLLVNFKLDCLPDVHVVDRYMETLKPIGLENDSAGTEYFIPENEGYDINLLPAKFKSGFIAFAIGGSYFTKKLPAEKVIEACRQISFFPVVLLGGKNELETGDGIVSNTDGNVLNLCGKLTIHESASLIRQANLVLTNDTGLMHIAAAFKKKTLTFWGNTVPAFGMWQYMPQPESVNLEVLGLSCRPCSKLGYDKCPKGHFKCMLDLDMGEAARWVKQNFTPARQQMLS